MFENVAATMSSSPPQGNSTSPAASVPLRLDIFPKNVAKPTHKTDLPKPHARVDKTPQLVYAYSLLSKDQESPSPTLDRNDSQDSPLDDKQREWVQLIDPILKCQYGSLLEQLVRAFVDNPLKASAMIEEIILLGPVLDRELYRSLLNCFISEFEQTTALDVILLQGLVQLVECASVGYLVGDDLIRIANVLSKELSITHSGTIEHVLHLTLSLARVLDVMVAGKVKDLNRDRDHQPMLQLLEGLRGNEDVVQRYEAVYAHQALQYAPDDEPPLQVLWRYAKAAVAGAGAVSSVFQLDPEELLNGLESLQKIGAEVVEAVKTGIEVVETLRVGAGGAIRVSETKSDFMKKRSWYLALQGTALFIRQGRLSDFNLVVSQAPCRHDANFQWGICRQLGEIAVDTLWDLLVRQQAVDFLGELYKSDAYWKPHADTKQWILTILVQISKLLEVSLKDRALALLADLKKDGSTELHHHYPLSRRLPLPTTSPLLAKVQEIPSVDYDLHVLRSYRIADFKQPVYIAPLAKPSLQAPDDTLFPLMEKVKEFLAGEGQVMLVLGDSGAGKSTFNRHLEHELWQDYNPGDRIPLFINLSSLERPEKDLVAEHLKLHNFLDDQIRELKLHHKFTLICDGYDESQLRTNLHHTNSLNQYGQWNTKLLVTCRTQYLGPDYRSRFAPMGLNQYARVANDLFQEAVIAPFTKKQIEDYVDRYIPLEPRGWVQKDYMDKMEAIPNLMDLVKNPFLLTLCLEALPNVVEGKTDLSRLRVTRVQLYDTFVQHWLGVNKRRLQDQMQMLSSDSQLAFEALVEDGFESNGIMFQQDLAGAIFQEQDGKPIVVYTQRRDGSSWKAQFFGSDPEISLLRTACLLSRVGARHRFVHRSILEYFYSCTIISGSTDSNEEFAPHSPSDASSIDDHPLSQRNLVVEPSIIQFLAERVQLESFKQQLLAFIEQSKTDERAARAAANAITILVAAGVHFNGADLRGIRIPEANISGGQFDSAQLQEADLTGVKLSKSWIRQADLSKAHMEGVQFGELPLLREVDSVTSVAYSPDRESFAVGLYNGDINVYDIATWSPILALCGHQGQVTGLAYSPTGLQLLSGSNDCSLRLWDCKTGSTDLVLEGHEDSVRAVAFSPLGNQVASASNDMTVRLWDSRTGANLFVLQDYTDGVSSVAYSPDGRSVVSGGFGGVTRIYDTHSGEAGLVLEDAPYVYGDCCVAYSPDGLLIVAGSGDGELQLWESTTGKSTKRWQGHEQNIYAVDFSPSSQWVASSSHDGAVKLWDSKSGNLVSVFTGHSERVEGVVFSPSGLQLASGGEDGTVRLWDVATAGTIVDMDGGRYDKIRGFGYSLDGRSLTCGRHSGAVRQYDTATGEPGPSLPCGHYLSSSAAFSSDGRQIAAAGWDYSIRTWDADAGIAVFVFQGHTHWITSLAFSSDGQWIVSGSEDKTVRLWNARSGRPGLVLSGHSEDVLSVTFSPCGRQVVSRSKDGTIRVWEVDSGESRIAADFGSGIDGARVRYSANGMQIALVRQGGAFLELWEEAGANPLHTLQHDGPVTVNSLSPCGQWIAASCGDSVWLWKAVSRDAVVEWRRILVIREFFEGVARVAAIDWKPNALEFAIATEAGCVQTWRLVDEPSEGFSARLLWSLGHTGFVATDAVIVDVVGLSTTNQGLLKQRGANDGSPPFKITSVEPRDVFSGESQDNLSGGGQGVFAGEGWGNFSYQSQNNYSDDGQDDFSDEGQDNFSCDGQDNFSDDGRYNFSDEDQGNFSYNDHDSFSNEGQDESQHEN